MPRTGRPRSFDRSLAIEQAMQVFWAHGYESSSLSLLKEAMGSISAPSFYAAFQSKEALFEEVLNRYLQTHGQVMASLYDAALPAREAIELALLGSARMQTDTRHPPGCLLVVSATTCSGETAAIQDILKKDRLRTRHGFQLCVARGIAAGELPPATDAKAMALMFDTFVRGLTTQARDGVSLPKLRASIQTLMKLWPTASMTTDPARLQH